MSKNKNIYVCDGALLSNKIKIVRALSMDEVNKIKQMEGQANA